MAAIQWGRKETIIFLPHSPIYDYGAVFLALVLTGFFVYLRFTFGQLPLQQYYTPIYVRAAARGAVNKTDKYQLLYVGDGTKASRLATEDDVLNPPARTASERRGNRKSAMERLCGCSRHQTTF
jgi:hypothetical protein